MKNARQMVRNRNVFYLQSAVHPAISDNLSITHALSSFSREAAKDYPEISLEYSSSIPEREVPKKLKLVLIRVVQESVANAIFHGKPSRIRIALGRLNRWLQLIVADNGKGFNSPDKGHSSGNGIGLDHMQKWVESSGGIFSLRSISGGGTTLKAEWKLGGI